ncbi:MAG: AraC family transcriptional regulator [Clostridiales bacterium]|nr:AraC family transcriptional regulator [Clostridiales bacterium]
MGKYRERSYNNWSEDSVRLILTVSQTAKSMYYYIQEVGYFKAFENYYTERENLSSFLVVYTLSGSGILKYRNREYRLMPGQVFFIDCMEYQFYQTSGRLPWEFLWVHFNGGASLAYFNQYIKNGTSVTGVRDEAVMKSIFWSMLETSRTRDYKTEAIASKLITDLLTELLISSCVNHTMLHAVPHYIHDVIRYIDKNYTQRITLDNLSESFAVNKFRLQKEFKRHIGLTPNDYVINCRLNRAKELLKYSDLSVSEISYRVGIENVSHFINLFKKSEHKTPLTFRSEWKGCM